MNKNKIIVSIILVIAFATLVGFAVLPIIENKPIKNTESIIEESSNIENNHISEENIPINENSNVDDIVKEELSAEDKEIKAEIAKYIDTEFDFRKNKQETVGNKTFSVDFFEVDKASDYKKVKYTNKSGDEFVYKADSGKLVYGIMQSAFSSKNTDSIDSLTAQKIATEYVKEKCNINEYKHDQYKEIDTGYYFCFTRYIGEYPSVSRYSVQIGYDGAIVYISDFTDTFDGKDLNYSKDFIDAKIYKALEGQENVQIKTIIINVYNGKICADCSYEITDATTNSSSKINLIIPLED